MMEGWLNAMRAQAAVMAGAIGQVRCGIVQNVDPSTYCAKVSLQPEDVLTGWLPIASAWVGAGWGLVTPPTPGQQVLVLAQEGHAEHGLIIGGLFSIAAKPPQAPTGELWMVHATGSFLKLQNDGSIAGHATVWTLTGDIHLTGNLVASGDISDKGGAHGTLDHFRTIYDVHVHPNVANGPGDTGLPIQQA
ncbi:phage baseplate assembly protein V [Acidisoma cladoniae]|uniref:phage baseplate assembly protein V n=1 Tax=Acidisoma cladoniae TaxID=3040935 RepID=UPI00254EA2AC|nr:phage baseplate assembly protein V [Acidisoma sp. PAMC 29798]